MRIPAISYARSTHERSAATVVLPPLVEGLGGLRWWIAQALEPGRTGGVEHEAFRSEQGNTVESLGADSALFSSRPSVFRDACWQVSQPLPAFRVLRRRIAGNVVLVAFDRWHPSAPWATS